jgi:hypothetical protein
MVDRAGIFDAQRAGHPRIVAGRSGIDNTRDPFPVPDPVPRSDALTYIEGLNYNEPKVVLVVMVVAAARPVVKLAEGLISAAARFLPMREGLSF